MLPLFLNLDGRRVVLVGDGAVAAAKRDAARVGALGARRAPMVAGVARDGFEPRQLDDAWLVVAAATAT